MIEIELLEGELEPIKLTLNRRVTLGTERLVPEEQLDRISLGRPACVKLEPSTMDAEARAFLRERKSAFWLLALTCSFRAIDDEPMTSA